jgi:hypothetical protein
MEGCAGDTMGEMAMREGGRGESCEGKRIGDMNGLPHDMLARLHRARNERDEALRPTTARHVCETVDNHVGARPGERWRIGRMTKLDIIRGAVDDEIAIRLSSFP